MNDFEHSPEFISRPELAKRWGVSGTTICRREIAGDLQRSKAVTQKPVHYPMSQVLRLEAAAPALAH